MGNHHVGSNPTAGIQKAIEIRGLRNLRLTQDDSPRRTISPLNPKDWWRNGGDRIGARHTDPVPLSPLSIRAPGIYVVRSKDDPACLHWHAGSVID
jgi:hypothetical protein